MTFGEDLRAARTEARLSQPQLAEMVGVSGFKIISQWENDHVVPKFENIDKLEAALNVRFNVVTPQDVPDGTPGDGPSKDAPPQPRKQQAKKSTGKAPAGMPSLRLQLEMPYRLGATALQSRLPATAYCLNEQAGPCAAAWDTFLLRYPKLREKIEQGAVASDIVNLVMAHMPIVQVAREEIAAQQAAMANFVGGEQAA